MTRNQLMIALSRVMIVIEAGEKGGTLNAGRETLKSKIPLYVAHYQAMSVDAPGNQILLNDGALKLEKSRSTNRANLTRVFESMEEDNLFKNLPRQGSLL